MTPVEFLNAIQRREPAPAYLFLGPDAYCRDLCRRALIDKLLPPEEREHGFIRHDLDEVSLAAVIDDARCYSLFAPRRLIWVSSAEEEEDAGLLGAYLRDPVPGVVLVFEASRYEFEGEDKPKVERVRKSYAAVREQVEFPRFTPAAARQLTQELSRRAELALDPAGIDLLVEALNADAWRISVEIEKLRLFVASGRRIGRDDIAALVPDARATTIFALVNALGRRDRVRALEILDLLVREGEYLPLALTFLGTQFRLALAAQEAGLRNAYEVQSHFTRLGTPMWRARAEQVAHTMTAFPREKLEQAIRLLFTADRNLRDARPDDRVIMESLILHL